jgi:tripartite-type tricarboxylate transporter receptor subunit TctC
MTMFTRRRALAGAAAFAAPSISRAQEFPTKPVKIVVPAAPGGALDIISRLIAQKSSEIVKQQFFIENKPGANWIIGMDYVAKSPPDGYTLLFIASSGITVNPHVFPNMPLDPVKDLAPITISTNTDFVLLANPSLPARNLAEFIAHLKANPGKLNHASNSATTMLVSALFKTQAGVDYVDVNYRGASQAIQDTMSGVTQFCFVDLGTGTGAIDGGTLRPLGITGAKRTELRPDLPTIAEQGLAGYAVSSATLLMAQTDLPAPIMQRLNGVFREALAAPDVKQKLTTMAQIVVGNSPAEATALLKPEYEQFGKLIRERGLKFDQ